ncbi:hypothetical protein Hanom_Chr08g00700511 [Helianthus anomalus]
MVQIFEELDLSKDALIQVTSRLRENLFEREGQCLRLFRFFLIFLWRLRCMKYDSRDSRGYGRGGHDDSPLANHMEAMVVCRVVSEEGGGPI